MLGVGQHDGPEPPSLARSVILGRMGKRVPERTQAVARARTRRAADRRTIDSERTIVLALGTFGWTIAFTDCPEVVEGLEAILSGWRFRRLRAAPPQRRDSHVART